MIRRTSLSFLAVGLFLAASCSNKSMPTQTGPPPTQGVSATPTPVPAGSATVNVGSGGNRFTDVQSGTTTTTIRAGQMVTWNFVAGPHSTTSGNCCSSNGLWDSGLRSSGAFSHTFPSAGTFPYFCTVHGAMMTGTVVVTP